MSFSYSAIQGLKARLADLLAVFEAEHPGATVRATIEVKAASGAEKIKVAIAGPYNQPTLPGMDDVRTSHGTPADDNSRWVLPIGRSGQKHREELRDG